MASSAQVCLHRTLRLDDRGYNRFLHNVESFQAHLGIVKTILFDKPRICSGNSPIKTYDIHHKEMNGRWNLSTCNKNEKCTKPFDEKPFTPEGASLYESHEFISESCKEELNLSSIDAIDLENHVRRYL